ncbi:MAG: transposase [Planctomycetaceae bacterium]
MYDEYVQRGESENRNKELKIDLCGERLSDHRFMANLFRFMMHAAALNLLIRLRRTLPEVPPQDRRRAPLPDAERPGPATGAELRHAQPATWRLRLIKVAAEVLVSCRRVLIRLSSAWPGLPTWRVVLQTVQPC